LLDCISPDRTFSSFPSESGNDNSLSAKGKSKTGIDLPSDIGYPLVLFINMVYLDVFSER